MEILGLEGKKFRLRLARREVVLMSNILNEVCNGFFLPQFQERIGVDEHAARRLLAEIHALAESMPREEEG